MIPSGLTSSVIGRANLSDGYVRVRDRQIVDAVADSRPANDRRCQPARDHENTS